MPRSKKAVNRKSTAVDTSLIGASTAKVLLLLGLLFTYPLQGSNPRVPAEKYLRPVKKENMAESVRCKADESRGEGA